MIGAAAEHHADDRVGRILLAHLLQPLGRNVAHHPAQAQDRDAVAQGIGLHQLVGDQDQGHALLAQAAHHLAQIMDALRRQHRGGLVEDQHLLAAPERAHDLDLLLLAQRQPADESVGIDLDAEQGGELVEALQGRRLAEALPPGAAQHQILDDRQARYQQHMLEDRADAEVQALARRADDHRPAGDQDLALVGLLHAGENADQCRFAGPVLAQQDMDLAGVKLQGNVVIGEHAGKALGDLAHGGDRRARGGHRGCIVLGHIVSVSGRATDCSAARPGPTCLADAGLTSARR